MACGSPTSYRLAGELGVGCLSFTISPPEELKVALEHYRAGIAEAKPVGDFITNQIAGFTTMYVGDNDAEAREWGGWNSVKHHERVGKYYGNVQERPGYGERSQSVQARIEVAHEDYQTSIEEARMCVGGVETVDKIVQRYVNVGIDELIGVVQYNHITHEQTMNTIRLMGEQIIPKYNTEAKAAVAAE
jgi:alkanesulfonate monooxygenase SsuD/methylene tetrahydromethanopterin reductase-like flavin-dependent oxidoreductase (luciferase family)